jgi:uncharacterized protein (TIGR03546 family)
MLIGLVPKGNLIALLLITLLFAIQVNRGSGLAAAFLFSWVGVLLDPLSHRVGWAILHIGALEPLFAWLSDVPIVPWTSFNNTVVMGSFVIGVFLFYPIYRVSQTAFTILAPLAAEQLNKYRIYHILTGTDFATRWKV